MLLRERVLLALSVFFFCITSSVLASDIPRNALVAEYLFEDANNLGLDTSGNNNHASNSGAVTGKGLVGGNAARFDGVDDFIQLPELSSVISYGKDFSISLWSSKYKEAHQAIFSGGYVNSASNAGLLDFLYYGGNLHTSMLKDYGASNGLSIEVKSSPVALNGKEYTTLVYANNELSIYVNGQLLATHSAQGKDWSHNYPYFLGAGSRAGVAYGVFLSGLIDNVRIYSRALNTSEIAQLHQETYVVPNNAPVAATDNFILQAESGVTALDILANDTDEDKSSLSITITNQSGVGGSATVSGQKLSYTPQQGYTGQDWVEYQLTDNEGEKSSVSRANILVRVKTNNIPQEGLLAEYLFEDVNNLGLDNSGNNYHASNQGATQGDGVEGRGVILDGVDDYIHLSAVNSYLQYNKDFSVSMWASKDKLGAYGLFTGGHYQGSGSNRRIRLMYNQEKIETAIIKNNAQGWKYIQIDSGELALNRYYHVAFTYQNNQLSFYLDGQLVGTDSMQGHDWSHNHPYAIGARASNYITTSQHLTGKVDNVRIYSRALNSAEIIQLYQERATNTAPVAIADSFFLQEENGVVELDVLTNDSDEDKGSLTLKITNQGALGGSATVSGQKLSYTPLTGYTGEDWIEYQLTDKEGAVSDVGRVDIIMQVKTLGIPQSGLVAEYLFEDPNNLGLDNSGHNRHANNSGAIQGQGIPGGKGAVFDGVDDFINLAPVSSYLQYNKDFSLSIWASKDKSEYLGLFSGGYYHNSSSNRRIELTFYQDKFQAAITKDYAGGGKVITIEPPALNIDQYYHLTFVYQANQLSFYVDGELIGTESMQDFDWGHNYPYVIGARSYNNLNTYQYLQGKVDNVRIYSRALSTNEITQLNLEGNAVPVANADSFSLKDNDGVTELDILANDTDEDKASLVVTITNQSGLGGSATVSGQKLRYTPTAGYVGEDWIEYKLTDKHGLTSSVARVSLSLSKPKPGLPVPNITPTHNWIYEFEGDLTVTIETDEPGASIEYFLLNLVKQGEFEREPVQSYTGPFVIKDDYALVRILARTIKDGHTPSEYKDHTFVFCRLSPGCSWDGGMKEELRWGSEKVKVGQRADLHWNFVRVGTCYEDTTDLGKQTHLRNNGENENNDRYNRQHQQRRFTKPGVKTSDWYCNDHTYEDQREIPRSGVYSVSIEVEKLDAPQGVKVITLNNAANNQRVVRLSWQQVAHASYYNIQYRKSGEAWQSLTAHALRKDITLSPGAYSFKVSACIPEGCEGVSEEGQVNFDIEDEPMLLISSSWAPSEISIGQSSKLNWNVSNATECVIQGESTKYQAIDSINYPMFFQTGTVEKTLECSNATHVQVFRLSGEKGLKVKKLPAPQNLRKQ